MTPTDRQLRILRLLVAGVKLEESSGTTKYELVITSPGVQPSTLAEMRSAGWLTQTPDGKWVATATGVQLTEVPTHVRQFAANAPAGGSR